MVGHACHNCTPTAFACRPGHHQILHALCVVGDVAGDPSKVVADLVGPLPSGWPLGGLVGLITEKVPRKLPVAPWLYAALIDEDASVWQDKIVPLDGKLAACVTDRVVNVRVFKV